MNRPGDLQIAAAMAERELQRLVNFPDMLCDIAEFRSEYTELFDRIRLKRQDELDDAKKTEHQAILQEFAAEAGFLIGLEIGRRLGGVR